MTVRVRCIECDHYPAHHRPCPKTRQPVTKPNHTRTCAAFEPRQPRTAPVRVEVPDKVEVPAHDVPPPARTSDTSPAHEPSMRPPLDLALPVPDPEPWDVALPVPDHAPLDVALPVPDHAPLDVALPVLPPLEVALPVLPPLVRALKALADSGMARNVAVLGGAGKGKVLVRLLPCLPAHEAFQTMTVIDQAMRS